MDHSSNGIIAREGIGSFIQKVKDSIVYSLASGRNLYFNVSIVPHRGYNHLDIFNTNYYDLIKQQKNKKKSNNHGEIKYFMNNNNNNNSNPYHELSDITSGSKRMLIDYLCLKMKNYSLQKKSYRMALN